MNCPKCGGKTEVTDTEKFSMYVWRKRRCLNCDHRMHTHENIVEDTQTYRRKKREDTDG